MAACCSYAHLEVIMKETNIIRKGRRLAYLLRYDNEALEMGKIDSNGWRNVAEIIECGFSRPLLEEIVATNDKKRYEFNADFTKIRAKQGHSIPVDVELAIATPPEYLYHGTCEDTKEIILREGCVDYMYISPRTMIQL